MAAKKRRVKRRGFGATPEVHGERAARNFARNAELFVKAEQSVKRHDCAKAIRDLARAYQHLGTLEADVVESNQHRQKFDQNETFADETTAMVVKACSLGGQARAAAKKFKFW